MRFLSSERKIATMIAIECGLCPKTENGYDVSNFEKFWVRFIRVKRKHNYRISFWLTVMISIVTTLVFRLLTDRLLMLLQ